MRYLPTGDETKFDPRSKFERATDRDWSRCMSVGRLTLNGVWRKGMWLSNRIETNSIFSGTISDT